MRRRPSGESGPPVATIVRRLARFGRRPGALERRLGEELGRGDQDGGAFLGGGGQQVAGGGGCEDDGGAFQQRREPGPGRADDQQPVVRPQVGVQQQLGQRADQRGGRPEAGRAARRRRREAAPAVAQSPLPARERSADDAGKADRGCRPVSTRRRDAAPAPPAARRAAPAAAASGSRPNAAIAAPNAAWSLADQRCSAAQSGRSIPRVVRSQCRNAQALVVTTRSRSGTCSTSAMASSYGRPAPRQTRQVAMRGRGRAPRSRRYGGNRQPIWHRAPVLARPSPGGLRAASASGAGPAGPRAHRRVRRTPTASRPVPAARPTACRSRWCRWRRW